MSSSSPSSLVVRPIDHAAVAKSVTYLLRKQATLSAYSDVEDLVAAEPEPKDLIYHLGVLKNALVMACIFSNHLLTPRNIHYDSFKNSDEKVLAGIHIAFR